MSRPRSKESFLTIDGKASDTMGTPRREFSLYGCQADLETMAVAPGQELRKKYTWPGPEGLLRASLSGIDPGSTGRAMRDYFEAGHYD